MESGTTPAKPLRCYHVSGSTDQEDDEVMFAGSSIEAKRRWASEHGDSL